MKNFLDTHGLSQYDHNIKNYIDNAVDSKADDSVFGASGSTHSKGLVPDPGATSGSTKFLREDGTWAVPAGGGGGGGSGDVNVIESISVNNVAQTVDANKNVNIIVPAVASAIADNDNGYATGDQVYDYVQANKGDANVIESISVNGSAQTITNKGVNITVPTVASAIADSDTGYATGDQVYDYAEAKANKTTAIGSSPTDVQYPSALAVKTYVDAHGFDPSSMPTVSVTPSLNQTQADWNQTNTSAVDYIKNKPTIPSAQVNSDWNASSGVAQILNKPNIPVPAQAMASGDTGYVTGDMLYDVMSDIETFLANY